MAEELDLEDKNEDKVENTRIKDLSSKVKQTSQERDDAIKKAADADAKAQTAEKERDFYASFADITATNPAAKDHKDEIKSKVLAGYTLEDATVSVLNKVGKLTPTRSETQSPAGGSATTVPHPQNPTRNLSEMPKEELRKMIEENDEAIMEFLRTGH